MKLRSAQNGFTLLELLLVIAILAGMLVMAIRWQKHENTAHKQQIAANELQTVLQAANNYHARMGKWPENNIDDDCSTQTMDNDFTQHFLPTTAQTSAYHTHYCWGTQSSADDEFGAQVFSVYLPITGAHALRDAAHIAAELPNARSTASLTDNIPCDETDNQCFAQAQTIGYGDAQHHIGIQAIGRCLPNTAPDCAHDSHSACCQVRGQTITTYHVRFPKCLASQAKITAIPVDLNMPGVQDTLYNMTTVYNLSRLGNNAVEPANDCHSIDSKTTECNIGVSVRVEINQKGKLIEMNAVPNDMINSDKVKAFKGSVGAMYIAYCQ